MGKQEKGRRWTLILLRGEGVESYSWRLDARAAAALAGCLLLLLVAAGAGAGLWWAGRQESEQVRRLSREVDRLAAERSRVLELAARLDSIEWSYRQLRQVMGGEVASSGRDVRLPPASGGSGGQLFRGAAARGSSFAWPLVERGFVTRVHREQRTGESGHPGLDIAVPSGAYVRATRGGIVVEAGRDRVYGRFVRIDHGDGLLSLYGHNAWLFVSEGDTVRSKQVIALSGNTGRSTAPHLHFEMEEDGESVDPARLLRGSG